MDELIHSFLAVFPTWGLFILIVATIFMLGKGADILVDEAVSLSLHMGIPKIIIGATIVSLGTTLPEASVSVLAAINGNPDLALGNAIGSIIVDTGLIIGLAALIGHLPVDRIIVERQGKIQVWAGILLAFLCLPFMSGGSTGNISQWFGWILLLLLVIYIYISIKWSKSFNPTESLSTNCSCEEAASSEEVLIEEKSPLMIQLFKLIAGVALVIISSKILIPSVEITAVRVGIPQSIIAATIVAFGTSLPELVTAITAVRKGHGELAVGNIVGADILNVLFVVGAAASVTSGGLDIPSSFYKLQIPTMIIVLFTFRMFSRGKNECITKKEGLVLLSIYIIYLILNYTWI